MGNPSVAKLAGVIYGEAAGSDYKTMKMVGSSIINRLNSGRVKEFGSNIDEVANKGYYSVKNPNEPYKEIMSGKFNSPEGEKKYKQAYAIAGGLVRGTIEPDKGLFYFTQKEENKLRKTPKVFDFRKVKEVGTVDKYKVYDY